MIGYIRVGTGLPDGPSKKFGLDRQILSHNYGMCSYFGASSPKIGKGPWCTAQRIKMTRLPGAAAPLQIAVKNLRFLTDEGSTQ